MHTAPPQTSLEAWAEATALSTRRSRRRRRRTRRRRLLTTGLLFVAVVAMTVAVIAWLA